MLRHLAARLGVNPRKFIPGLVEKLRRSLPGRLWALYFAWKAIRSPRWKEALLVAYKVSQEPSSRNLDTWTYMNRLAISQPKQSENVYRNALGRLEFKGDPLILELAYQVYKRKRSL